jgi:protein-S-isoprenylcysteine O-methyltransferase Ste14
MILEMRDDDAFCLRIVQRRDGSTASWDGNMKSKAAAVIGSVLFFIVTPGTVAGLIPWLITRWHAEQTPFAPLLQVLGSCAVAAGLAILIESFARFALQGIGTPAPTHPTRHLVIEGAYRYVRNPMYVAVLAIIVGQAALFANVRLLTYGVLVWLLCHLFVITYEEPTLLRTFGSAYDAYRRNVPRWIPRLRRWHPPQ